MDVVKDGDFPTFHLGFRLLPEDDSGTVLTLCRRHWKDQFSGRMNPRDRRPVVAIFFRPLRSKRSWTMEKIVFPCKRNKPIWCTWLISWHPWVTWQLFDVWSCGFSLYRWFYRHKTSKCQRPWMLQSIFGTPMLCGSTTIAKWFELRWLWQ